MTNQEQVSGEAVKDLDVEVPFAGNYDDDDAYNYETDGYDRRKVKVTCPTCQRVGSPLCSPKLIERSSGWRWVGCDHREPYFTGQVDCPGCKKPYTFTVHTPQ